MPHTKKSSRTFRRKSLCLEARHTLSLAESKKRRLQVPTSVFIPYTTRRRANSSHSNLLSTTTKISTVKDCTEESLPSSSPANFYLPIEEGRLEQESPAPTLLAVPDGSSLERPFLFARTMSTINSLPNNRAVAEEHNYSCLPGTSSGFPANTPIFPANNASTEEEPNSIIEERVHEAYPANMSPEIHIQSRLPIVPYWNVMTSVGNVDQPVSLNPTSASTSQNDFPLDLSVKKIGSMSQAFGRPVEAVPAPQNIAPVSSSLDVLQTSQSSTSSRGRRKKHSAKPKKTVYARPSTAQHSTTVSSSHPSHHFSPQDNSGHRIQLSPVHPTEDRNIISLAANENPSHWIPAPPPPPLPVAPVPSTQQERGVLVAQSSCRETSRPPVPPHTPVPSTVVPNVHPSHWIPAPPPLPVAPVPSTQQERGFLVAQSSCRETSRPPVPPTPMPSTVVPNLHPSHWNPCSQEYHQPNNQTSAEILAGRFPSYGYMSHGTSPQPPIVPQSMPQRSSRGNLRTRQRPRQRQRVLTAPVPSTVDRNRVAMAPNENPSHGIHWSHEHFQANKQNSAEMSVGRLPSRQDQYMSHGTPPQPPIVPQSTPQRSTRGNLRPRQRVPTAPVPPAVDPNRVAMASVLPSRQEQYNPFLSYGYMAHGTPPPQPPSVLQNIAPRQTTQQIEIPPNLQHVYWYTYLRSLYLNVLERNQTRSTREHVILSEIHTENELRTTPTDMQHLNRSTSQEPFSGSHPPPRNENYRN